MLTQTPQRTYYKALSQPPLKFNVLLEYLISFLCYFIFYG